MKLILVPVDFSECSGNAVRVAFSLAVKSKAELVLLHFMQGSSDVQHVPGGRALAAPKERKKAEADARAQLDELVKKATRAGIKSKHILAFTGVQDWIDDYIKPLGVDLVVMGTHSRKPIPERVLGSTTLQFIRHADVPVLVVKKRIDDFSIRQIVFVSDFNTDWIKPFRAVLDLAGLWKATLHLLYVCTPYHFVSTKKINAAMRRFMHQFRGVEFTGHLYNAINEEQGVHEFVDENNIDLVALTTHGRTGISHMIHPSIAEGVIKSTTTPVLIINIKKLLH